ncbi:MAG: response regulator [Elusimicrobiota bacterium]
MEKERRILAVDDDESILNVLSRFLKPLGYALAIASSGAEALEIIRRQPPDLILLDINMPGIDGLEVLRQARQLIPAVPVIMVTGSDDAEVAKQAMALGAVDYVTKPFDLGYLEDSIKANLASGQKE